MFQSSGLMGLCLLLVVGLILWVFCFVLFCFCFCFVFVLFVCLFVFFFFFATWCTDDGYGWWSQQICVVVVEALVNEFKVERRGRLWDYRN